MKRLTLAAVFAAALAGCGAGLLPVLTQVVAIAGEAAIVIERIAEFVDDSFSRTEPAPEQRRAIELAVDRARAAAAALHHAARAGNAAEREDVDRALLEFKVAYEHLLAVTQPLGVQAQDDGRLAAGQNTLGVPDAAELASLEVR